MGYVTSVFSNRVKDPSKVRELLQKITRMEESVYFLMCVVLVFQTYYREKLVAYISTYVHSYIYFRRQVEIFNQRSLHLMKQVNYFYFGCSLLLFEHPPTCSKT
ncbi:hypothetical protein AMECASPLE_039763 [Ameca splendens]|uniref:Uncharacterized protein n=1 Tax=Ameca splendens TaxID=208324 RepID=A0ABV0XXE5_9TELE